VQQTLWDCLHELMDIEGLQDVLKGIETGQIKVIARDLTAPSPMAQEIINAKPYAFLDDTPAEERRTLAIQQRRFGSPQEAAEIGRLNPEAIARVKEEAWPLIRNADELHDVLVIFGFITEQEASSVHSANKQAYINNSKGLLAELQQQQRATVLSFTHGQKLWVAAERLPELQALFPENPCIPAIRPMPSHSINTPEDALRELIRSRLEGLVAVTAEQLAAPLGIGISKVEQALLALEQQGIVMRGLFHPGATAEEWCERGLLARIHRYTLRNLRNEIEPVAPADFMRFLFQWHRLHDPLTGEVGLEKVLRQMEGYNLPAASWESEILANRYPAPSSSA
jgi:ATP-dependent Lhr-like helicase